MLRFYWSVARQVPRLLWNAVNHALALLAVALLALVLVNPVWANA